MRLLIVGGTGVIGAYVAKLLEANGSAVCKTSKDEIEGFVHLDLRQPIDESRLPHADVVIFAAGITDSYTCEKKPQESWYVNVNQTILVCEYYLKRRSRVIFLSSTAVYSDPSSYPHESVRPAPSSNYGFQKAAVEIVLTKMSELLSGNLQIVRLSKVLTPCTGIMGKWRSSIKSGGSIQAYGNLNLAPISLFYAAKCLIDLTLKKTQGVCHISGARNISYFELANKAIALGIIPSNGEAVIRLERKSGINYCTRLNMRGTKLMCQFQPQSLEECLLDLLKIE